MYQLLLAVDLQGIPTDFRRLLLIPETYSKQSKPRKEKPTTIVLHGHNKIGMQSKLEKSSRRETNAHERVISLNDKDD